MRDIADVLHFREDISPFVVHLTRAQGDFSARENLQSIIRDRAFRPGDAEVSDVRFGGNTLPMTAEQRRRFFGGVCFTETPLSGAHCLLEIRDRAVNLEPYGLVLMKDALRARGVAPVMYLNNERGDADQVVRALFGLIDSNPGAAERLLPLITVFGLKLWPPGAAHRPAGRVDFLWEREWRYPAFQGAFEFTSADTFCGLCPHEEIDVFEAAFAPVRFIDPRRTMKWYAQSLIASRQRLDIRYSVV
jgi:hypothetical protein